MRRTDFLGALSAAAAVLPVGAQAAIPTTRGIAGIPIPDTSLAREAARVARQAEPPEIFNHSLRTFFFAELVAQAKGIKHDSELVYVASILHDAGLAAAYMSSNQRFEVDGANLSREILQKHGVADQRADLVWDAIALHDSGEIAHWKQPEVRLVAAGVSADFGGYLSLMKRGDIVAVLTAAPRANFIETFLEAVAKVAARKPLATGGCFVTDVGYRRVPGFHLPNFCDEVRDNPFKSYGAAGQD